MKFGHFLLLLFSSASTLAQLPQRVELAGRVIDMALIKADDLSPMRWPSAQVQLKTISAVIKPGQNVYMMLQSNGIAPDSQALTAVYDLNPKINNLDFLSSNTILTLPTVAGEEQIHVLLGDGNLIQLTVDPDLRDQINQQVESLQHFAPLINHLTSSPETLAELKGLFSWYQQIVQRYRRRTDPPLRHSTLVELQTEAGLLHMILANAQQTGRQITNSERGQINSIYEDMKLEMAQYGQILAGTVPRGQAFYKVTVNIKAADLNAVGNLRVYYTYNGLFHVLPAQPPIPTYGFPQLGSGTSENLLMKNYQIWAAKDGDANHPLTPPYLLRIDANSQSSLNVELSLVGAHSK